MFLGWMYLLAFWRVYQLPSIRTFSPDWSRRSALECASRVGERRIRAGAAYDYHEYGNHCGVLRPTSRYSLSMHRKLMKTPEHTFKVRHQGSVTLVEVIGQPLDQADR